MKRQTLMEYLEIGEASLDREIIAGRLPAPIVIGGRQHWYREAVDKALERIAGGIEADYMAEMRRKVRA